MKISGSETFFLALNILCQAPQHPVPGTTTLVPGTKTCAWHLELYLGKPD